MICRQNGTCPRSTRRERKSASAEAPINNDGGIPRRNRASGNTNGGSCFTAAAGGNYSANGPATTRFRSRAILYKGNSEQCAGGDDDRRNQGQFCAAGRLG